MTRIASSLSDERHLDHALVLLATLGGVPSVYAGDEQAFRGIKEDRKGGDDAVRPAFPDTPADLAPYGWPRYRQHQVLIGMRRRHPWLVRARTQVLHLTNTLFAYTVGHEAAVLAVVLNVGDRPVEAALPEGLWRRVGGPGTVVGATASLPPAGWVVAEPAGAASGP